MKVTVHIDDCCADAGERCPVRPVFVIGPVRDAPKSVAKTPQFRRFPILGEIMAAVKITATQQVDLTFKTVDKKGNPAPIDTTVPPVWATDNTDLLTLTPSPDGMSCTVVATGVLGTAKVQMTCDANPSAAEDLIIGTLDVEVGPGSAFTVELVPGTPTEQPDVPPPTP